ncbi:putative lipoamide acyltransferase component of branched-chain alpha-keto acid dehydrogenase complex [Capnocytophaga canis]|uniref:Dihydrolipoamide acetyltransferase component of pyruvate dehydrogenase complex n=1 Tax=Capnocytophaga canis TaxID=1848903 RepID=A0A0B7I5B9_9FLAO|nr:MULTISPECIES: dihydrolipoamide acetyltransferase family protein [Capnocytophaga]ATA73428.1 diapophytoene dehydrogenase [Capnocytophaga sp. H4358]CEN43997.1 putative lipoamide acyltransferase component of branched-chain alpha-keto acid dehydrogenase complex [Capnocytophaga canis]CEN45969.1 putative lipoamide acyltransferase component of branched-chain alpha-keto acid dehydrogenase complex [Capnocytophaga canis]
MAKYELKLPQMGESVAEAIVTNWLKKVGDTVEVDEGIVEVATDKVDSEVPSEVSGVVVELRFEVDQVVKIGEVMAIIETEASAEAVATPTVETTAKVIEKEIEQLQQNVTKTDVVVSGLKSDRFYSPLVKSIAQKEGISLQELDQIKGTGADNRVTKNDMLSYLENREKQTVNRSAELPQNKVAEVKATSFQKGDERIEMSRMGKLIAEHMVHSKHTSPHVQSFTEVDVTRIWNWRNKVKKAFEAQEGEKFTFTPIFMEAVAKALKDYPMMNISLEGTTIIKKKNINIGMATALPDGNLIVPVIKNADQLNLRGMTKVVNDLAKRARANQLKPDEIKDGTYTVTNIGSFGNVFGTPIINQPQVGILAIGAIRKTPAVIETPEGDVIGIRYKMMLSHSYDHRVVNGALGGMFVQRVGEYLENWDMNRDI